MPVGDFGHASVYDLHVTEDLEAYLKGNEEYYRPEEKFFDDADDYLIIQRNNDGFIVSFHGTHLYDRKDTDASDIKYYNLLPVTEFK